MSEHWPVSNEGVGMPPQPLERENARLREALRRSDAALGALMQMYYPGVPSTLGAQVVRAMDTARAALGDQTEEAEDG